MPFFRLTPCLVTVALMLTAPKTGAAEIKLIASNAVKEPYSELIPDFEKASGHKVMVSWSGTTDAVNRIEGGEVADVVIVPAVWIERMIASGKLAAGSRLDLVRSMIGVAVRIGAPKPNLSSGERLRTYLLNAKAIVLSGGPSGVYLGDLFQKTGLWDKIGGKTIRLGSGLSPGDTLRQGKADIGFTQVSEFLAVKGIDYVGPLPSDMQQVTIFSAGVHKAAPAKEAAQALLRYLSAPEAVPVLKKTGLEPS